MIPMVVRNWKPTMEDYVRWKEEMLQYPKQIAISSGEVREVWRCPPDELLQLEGKELAFSSFLDSFERSLYWHLLKETGRYHDRALKVHDCVHERLRIPRTLPTVCPFAFGLKILDVVFNPRVLNHVAKQLRSSPSLILCVLHIAARS